MFYTYIIRCADNSLYTGINKKKKKRLSVHQDKKGAKYTKSHEAIKIECAWKSKDKSTASKLEYQIKQLNKNQKERLVDGEKLSTFLSGIVDCRRYRKIID